MQKFIIKKNAIIKVGEIFGIEVKFIDEDNEKEKKLREKKQNSINYCIPRLESNDKYIYVNGNNLNKESDDYEIGKTSGTASYISGGISGCIAAEKAIKAANFANQAIQNAAKAAQWSAKAAKLADEVNNINIFSKALYDITGITSAYSKAAQIAASNAAAAESAAQTALAQSSIVGTSATLSKCVSVGLFRVGIVLGIGFGAYFTHKFCEELLDKFVDYYKQNSNKIINSYKTAAEYFDIK